VASGARGVEPLTSCLPGTAIKPASLGNISLACGNGYAKVADNRRGTTTVDANVSPKLSPSTEAAQDHMNAAVAEGNHLPGREIAEHAGRSGADRYGDGGQRMTGKRLADHPGMLTED
jgi:hypothetical protein